MREICEVMMLICFGLSWPISVVKSLRTGSTKGKSVFFLAVVIIGYIAGITGKLVGGQVSFPLYLYCFNLAMVSADLCIYFVNRRKEGR